MGGCGEGVCGEGGGHPDGRGVGGGDNWRECRCKIEAGSALHTPYRRGPTPHTAPSLPHATPKPPPHLRASSTPARPSAPTAMSMATGCACLR